MSIKSKPIVFANPVRDLTLARYLAAMEVDFFGIDLDDPDERKTKTLIHQIREWVEGPKLIGVSSMPSQNIKELFPMDGYYLDIDFEMPQNSIVFQSQQFYLNNPGMSPSFVIINDPQDFIANKNCILMTDFHSNPINHSNISGYMISPSKEDKIGLYDFEKLDKWFEELRMDS